MPLAKYRIFAEFSFILFFSFLSRCVLGFDLFAIMCTGWIGRKLAGQSYGWAWGHSQLLFNNASCIHQSGDSIIISFLMILLDFELQEAASNYIGSREGLIHGTSFDFLSWYPFPRSNRIALLLSGKSV